MSTTKVALKLRLDTELLAEFDKLHPNYGEKSRVFRELVSAYVDSATKRHIREKESKVIDDAVSKIKH